jgi:hypothetical protein
VMISGGAVVTCNSQWCVYGINKSSIQSIPRLQFVMPIKHDSVILQKISELEVQFGIEVAAVDHS